MALTLGLKPLSSKKVLEKGAFFVGKAFTPITRKYKNPKVQELLSRGLERLRDKRGVFTAAMSDDYNACWMRDQLYANFAYYYLGNKKKFKRGLRVVFDMLYKSKDKIDHAICHMPTETHDYIHAKFCSETLDEMTNDWGHHQIDAIGLFLFMVGFAHERGIKIVETEEDREIMQLLVAYLTGVRYWEYPDNGMWEEWQELHSSSIGAAVAGLRLVKKQKLAVVANSLIENGEQTLCALLPKETPVRDQDLAQLSLIWPYKVVDEKTAKEILDRVTRNLVQTRGLNRYLGDNYYRSHNGVSAEWTFGFFWLSIIYAEYGDKHDAEYWFNHGIKTMTPEGFLPELYQDGNPNKNTPLAWSHSLALIAQMKLSRGK